MFFFKRTATFFLRKRALFWVSDFSFFGGGGQVPHAPPPPGSATLSAALDCAPSGALRKVHGANFLVPSSL